MNKKTLMEIEYYIDRDVALFCGLHKRMNTNDCRSKDESVEINNINNWVSINELNPTFNVPVLCVIKHRDDIGAKEIQVCFLGENGEWSLEPIYIHDVQNKLPNINEMESEITHWMRLTGFPV